MEPPRHRFYFILSESVPVLANASDNENPDVR